ncbi:MAG TPA: 4Fe-4S ferredoxin [Nitrospiraceae bacterium]|jgi:cytochrome c oxidase accessory protein FixG|nr:4Fe-4S ferredoxin [Nitrospiraceae bacterium]
MTIKTKGIQRWRRLTGAVQGAVILGIPFLRIGGESALRFDIPSLRLHFFGVTLWMDEFFLVLVAAISVTFFIGFITLLFGRIWCGWLCPQTVLADYTSSIDSASSRGLVRTVAPFLGTAFVCVVVGADLIWYFVSPYEFFERLFAGSLGNVIWGFWIVLSGVLFIDLVALRYRFCATVCPYAKLQSVLYDSKTLVIAFDPARKQECTNCMTCVRTCPVGIDIRNGATQACVNCAACVDACTKVMAKRGAGGLIGYFFGLPGETGRILRQNVVLIGSVTVLFCFFLVYLFYTRMPVDVTVLPNNGFPPRITADGVIINSFLLAVSNRGKSDLTLNVRMEGINGDVSIKPNSIKIKAEEDRKIVLYVTAKAVRNHGPVKSVNIFIETSGPRKIAVLRETSFVIPED